MRLAYYLLPGFKVVPNEGIVFGRGKIWSALHELGVAATRIAAGPIIDFEFACGAPVKTEVFFSLPLRIDPKQDHILSYFVPVATGEGDAYLLKLRSRGIVRFTGRDIAFDSGSYFFLGHSPSVDSNNYSLQVLRSILPNELRDGWVLSKLNQDPKSAILELGSGHDGRLYQRIMSRFPGRKYLGVDRLPCGFSNVLRGDLFDIPVETFAGAVVIAQEVVEHFDAAHRIEDLVGLLKSGSAKRFLFTTPNSAYTALLGVPLRHPDHKFELSESDLRLLKCRLRAVGVDMNYVPIGLEASSIAPSWGCDCKL